MLLEILNFVDKENIAMKEFPESVLRMGMESLLYQGLDPSSLILKLPLPEGLRRLCGCDQFRDVRAEFWCNLQTEKTGDQNWPRFDWFLIRDICSLVKARDRKVPACTAFLENLRRRESEIYDELTAKRMVESFLDLLEDIRLPRL